MGAVQEEIREVPLAIPRVAMASTTALGLSLGFGPEKKEEYSSSQPCWERDEDLEIGIETGSSPVLLTKDNPLPIFLKFEDVEYTVGLPSGNPMTAALRNVAPQMSVEHEHRKHILKGITGSIGPGEVLALMGPSGSGKTTLLKIVGGRLSDHVKGCITYNEIPYSNALKRRIGFVAQDDILFPQLTVEETLVFAAFLRLPTDMNRQQKYLRAESILKELGLERLFDKIVYTLQMPPHQGWGRNRERDIWRREKEGEHRAGRTIITTIHQPSSRMFYMFDKLLLISEGYPLYHGKAGSSMQYFSALGFVPQLAMNPAEFLLYLATGHVHEITIPEALKGSPDSEEFAKDLVECKSELEPKEKEKNRKAKVPTHLQLAIQLKMDWTMTWLEQFVIIWKRTFRERRRDYWDVVRLLQAVGVAVLLGLLWWRSKIGTEAQLRDQAPGMPGAQRELEGPRAPLRAPRGGRGPPHKRPSYNLRLQVGLLFYICIFWTSASIFGSVYVFPFEKFFLVKERKADMYRLSVYYVCSTLCDMEAHLFYPTVFVSILYFMAGFKRTTPCFFLTVSAVLLLVITSQGAGELIGAAVLSVRRAGIIASLMVMLLILTGGFYVQHMPSFMRWMKYLSFMYYGFRLIVKVQYSADDLYECGSSVDGCRSLQSSPSFDTISLNGGLEEVWVLLAMALAYRLLAYVCLRRSISVCPC
ncbi:hypothetical protein Taro_043595 [Colocasia esculenta]|uniref:ABC transporter domain-containing protein n=1 Tax=Colocasia esculenta TaxID=4460 RepID=A0A843WRU0_COLES|nr:hypothetical protein [Colocasia esculenta]